jgi:hypothetical protein
MERRMVVINIESYTSKNIFKKNEDKAECVITHTCNSALRGLRQEDLEFKASLANLPKPYFKKKKGK